MPKARRRQGLQHASVRALWACVALWAALMPQAARAAAPHNAAREEEATSALYRCFEQGLEESDEGLPPIAPGPATELFFWHQLGEAHRELGGTAQLGWCKPFFLDPMRQAQKTLLDTKPARAPKATGPQAFTKLQSVNVTQMTVTSHHIVEAAEAHGASRHRGAVGAIVRQALASPDVAHWGLIGVEEDFIVAAAQSLDTLLYHAGQWHATSDAESARPAPEEVKASHRQFVEHVATVGALSRAGVADEAALLSVGLTAGLIVDLYVHRGMTPAEWTAIHVAHAPFGHAQREGVDRVQAQAAVLRVWRSMLGGGRPQGTVTPPAQRSLAAGKPEEAVMMSLGRLAPEARPLEAGEIWQQVRHANAYKALQQGAAPPPDLSYWHVDQTVDAIIERLQASGPQAR